MISDSERSFFAFKILIIIMVVLTFVHVFESFNIIGN